ncbi:MAG: hypothetical protein ACYC4Q_11330 [Victivallaceae bacterium]
MSKMSNARPDSYHRVIIAEALAIAILFHMALLFLFYYSPPQLKNSNSSTQKIAMLNLHDHEESAMKEIAAWLEYHDPSLISRPDQKFGYGVLCRKPDFRPPLADLPREKKIVSSTNFEKFKMLAPESPLKYDLCSRFINYTPTPLPKTEIKLVPEVITDSKYPTAVYGNGIELKPFFEKPLPENLKSIAATAKWSKFVLAFQGEGLMPRISVEESSGSQELDRAAIKEILCNTDKFAPELAKPGDIVTVNVIWNRAEVKK